MDTPTNYPHNYYSHSREMQLQNPQQELFVELLETFSRAFIETEARNHYASYSFPTALTDPLLSSSSGKSDHDHHLPIGLRSLSDDENSARDLVASIAINLPLGTDFATPTLSSQSAWEALRRGFDLLDKLTTIPHRAQRLDYHEPVHYSQHPSSYHHREQQQQQQFQLSETVPEYKLSFEPRIGHRSESGSASRSQSESRVEPSALMAAGIEDNRAHIDYKDDHYTTHFYPCEQSPFRTLDDQLFPDGSDLIRWTATKMDAVLNSIEEGDNDFGMSHQQRNFELQAEDNYSALSYSGDDRAGRPINEDSEGKTNSLISKNQEYGGELATPRKLLHGRNRPKTDVTAPSERRPQSATKSKIITGEINTFSPKASNKFPLRKVKSFSQKSGQNDKIVTHSQIKSKSPVRGFLSQDGQTTLQTKGGSQSLRRSSNLQPSHLKTEQSSNILRSNDVDHQMLADTFSTGKTDLILLEKMARTTGDPAMRARALRELGQLHDRLLAHSPLN